jgi:hypothetical protein
VTDKNHAHTADGMTAKKGVGAKLAFDTGVLLASRAFNIAERGNFADIHCGSTGVAIGNGIIGCGHELYDSDFLRVGNHFTRGRAIFLSSQNMHSGKILLEFIER